MTRAILAWELGGGQGHIQRLIALARHLEIYGIEPVFALRNLNAVKRDFPWKVMQAPMAITKALDGQANNNSSLFTDILYIFGFSSKLALSFQIEAWQDMMNAVKPGFIIADFAPTLVLAARGKVPTIVIGNGFTVPPPLADFPPIREPLPATSLRRSIEVALVVHQTLGECGVVGQMLNGDRTFIFSIPELDLYRDVRSTASQYVGIHNAPLQPRLGNIKSGDCWGYISSDWLHYELVVNTLNPECVFGDLNTVLSGKSLAIHHGGPTTSIACLLAGIPQLLLPKHREQSLNALALERLGVARYFIHPTAVDLQDTLATLPTLFDNVAQQAQNLSQWNHNYLERVINSCISFI